MGLKSFVKKIPLAIWVFENQMRWKFLAKGWIRRLGFLLMGRNRYSKQHPMSKIVALTVSTNYSDLLEICISFNKNRFDQWVIVTDKSDLATLKVLETHPDILTIYWDPYKNGAVFDKGSAIRAAQKLAYSKFPGHWYLIMDSDIILPDEFDSVRANLAGLNSSAIYGANRIDYGTEIDLLNRTNGVAYEHSSNGDWVLGFFQLFRTPLLYRPSKDASYCDIEFQYLFKERKTIQGLVCSHLGLQSHWGGRGPNSSDFEKNG
jgi:hypothetical protein